MISFEIKIIQKSSGRIVSITPPLHLYYADPFIIGTSNDGVTIIYEVYDRVKRKGRIDYAIINFEENKVTQRVLLEEAFHLSYPCPILIDDDLYISPESSEIGKQYFYKITKSGDYYKSIKISSIRQRMVDATFFNTKNPSELSVYFYTGLGNDDGMLVSCKLAFREHAILEIQDLKVIGSARPAGILPGKIQPFQRSGGGYGKGLDFKNIFDDFYVFGAIENISSVDDYIISQSDFSHHINECSNYICFDILSSPKINIKQKFLFSVIT